MSDPSSFLALAQWNAIGMTEMGETWSLISFITSICFSRKGFKWNWAWCNVKFYRAALWCKSADENAWTWRRCSRRWLFSSKAILGSGNRDVKTVPMARSCFVWWAITLIATLSSGRQRCACGVSVWAAQVFLVNGMRAPALWWSEEGTVREGEIDYWKSEEQTNGN